MCDWWLGALDGFDLQTLLVVPIERYSVVR
jgi:hypothetical protein